MNKAERQRHAAWALQLEGVMDLWCHVWPESKRQDAREQFERWMRVCDAESSSSLTGLVGYLVNALANAKEGNWARRPLDAAYVMCREQFYGYAAEAYARRFPIHGPWPKEVDDVPF
ncbi:MAG: hypothetical protein JNK17_02275 [Hydrogenophaga sp.]|nr:hypothetical protein [Hydrogenophaga sp.]